MTQVAFLFIYFFKYTIILHIPASGLFVFCTVHWVKTPTHKPSKCPLVQVYLFILIWCEGCQQTLSNIQLGRLDLNDQFRAVIPVATLLPSISCFHWTLILQVQGSFIKEVTQSPQAGETLITLELVAIKNNLTLLLVQRTRLYKYCELIN